MPDRNKSILWMLAVILIISGRLFAAFEYPVGSINSFAMSGCLNLQHSAPLDLYNNPALMFQNKVGVELSFSRLYNIPDFDLTAGLLTYNYRRLTLGVGSTQLSGSDYYWERSYLLSASTALYRNVRAGLSLNYLRVEFAGGYRDLSLVSFDAGCLWEIKKNLFIASTLHNFNRPRFESGAEPLPIKGEFAVSYVLSPEFSFFATDRFEESERDRLSLGQQLNISHDFSLRFGIGSDPTEFGGGASFSIGSWFFDYGFRDNVYLGGTHRFGIRYQK